MMSGATIAAMSRKAARDSARNHIEPFTVWPDDLRDWKAELEAGNYPRLPFPFIGSRTPRGWKKTGEYFVDASGFGAPGEPALTIPQFIGTLRENYGYAIIEAGQFQVYIGEFQRTKAA